LSLSQPAVSHALNRLRDLTGDRLFIRTKKGLMPTAHAKALLERVQAVVVEARSLLAKPDFQPLTSTRRFSVGSSDYAALSLVPALIARVRSLAPRITLKFEMVQKQTLGDLEQGNLDLCFWGATPPKYPLAWRGLFSEKHVGVITSSHPLAQRAMTGTISLSDYLEFPHIVVSFQTPGTNRVDAALATLQEKREVAVSTHSFASVIPLIFGSNIIATMPKRMTHLLKPGDNLIFPLPFDVPDYDYGVIWHERARQDQGVAWLLEQIVDIV
jgi:DNA-binding transcriptional LysR family regulator